MQLRVATHCMVNLQMGSRPGTELKLMIERHCLEAPKKQSNTPHSSHPASASAGPCSHSPTATSLSADGTLEGSSRVTPACLRGWKLCKSGHNMRSNCHIFQPECSREAGRLACLKLIASLKPHSHLQSGIMPEHHLCKWPHHMAHSCLVSPSSRNHGSMGL